jgi:hypothetical protein
MRRKIFLMETEKTITNNKLMLKPNEQIEERIINWD